jgi:hypothetical protein
MSKGPTIVRDGKIITILMPDEGAADHLEVALTHRQWVQVLPDGVKLAQMDEEPKLDDMTALAAHSLAPIFRPCDPTAAPIVTCDTGRLASECTDSNNHWSCYIQGLGAGVARDSGWSYERCFDQMIKMGFILLRSPRGPDGKFWEIWYTPGPWHLKQGLHNCNRKRLVEWLFDTVRPGAVSFDGERWCLTWAE